MQETDNVGHLSGVQLLMNGVQVVGLILPELEFRHRSWIIALFKCLFGLQLKDVFDLFGPGNDGTFENMGFVLVQNVRVHQFGTRHGQHGLPVDQADHHEGLRDEVVVLLHQVFGDQVGPALLVVWVLEHRAQHLLEKQVAVLVHILGELEEDQRGLNGFQSQNLAGEAVTDHAFLLEFGGLGALDF